MPLIRCSALAVFILCSLTLHLAAGAVPTGGNRRFDPMSMFDGIDADKDGKVTVAELDGNRMADRIKGLDKDGDDVITREEFRTGVSTLFGGRRGGRGGSGGNRKDTRPDRPQRPELAGS